MMIVIVLLSFLQLSSAKLPFIREQDPIVIDGEEGVLFEIPEYEDPELVEYELSAMGQSPVLSLLELPKNRQRLPSSTSRDTKESGTKVNAETILDLSEIIQRLQGLQTDIRNGRGSNHRNELSKAIHDLMKLESSLNPDVRQLLNSMQRSMSLLKPMIKIGIMPLMPGKFPGDDAVRSLMTSDSGAVFGLQRPITAESKHSEEVKSTMSPIESLVHEVQDDKDDGVSIYESKWTFKAV